MLLEVLRHCYSSTEKLLFEHDPQAMDGRMDGWIETIAMASIWFKLFRQNLRTPFLFTKNAPHTSATYLYNTAMPLVAVVAVLTYCLFYEFYQRCHACGPTLTFYFPIHLLSKGLTKLYKQTCFSNTWASLHIFSISGRGH